MLPQALAFHVFGLLICVGIQFAEAKQADGSDNVTLPVKVAFALAGLAVAAHAVWHARQFWRRALPEEAVAVPVYGHPEGVDPQRFVVAALSVALLDLERSGAIRLALVGPAPGALRAVGMDGGATPWPEGTLEFGLWRDGDLAVEQLVHDWLGDQSHHPNFRALRIIEDGAEQRGWPCGDPSAVAAGLTPADLQTAAAQACALLDHCRQTRPPLWQALQRGVAQGLASREQPPRHVQRGQASVPVYDYPEQPVSALRRGAAPAAPATALRAVDLELDLQTDLALALEAAPAPAGSAAGDGQALTAAAPKVVGPVATRVLVFMLGLLLPGATLYFRPDAALLHLGVGALVLLACWKMGVAYRRRQAGYAARGVLALETGPIPMYGRDARRPLTLLESLGTGLSLAGIAVFASSWGGGIAWLITAVVVFGLLSLGWDNGRPSAAAVVRGVGQRLDGDSPSAPARRDRMAARASASPVAPSLRAAAPSPGAGFTRSIEVLRGRDLPAADPATADLFARWPARHRVLQRLSVWRTRSRLALCLGVPALWIGLFVSKLASEGATFSEMAVRMGAWHLVCALLLLGGLTLRSLGLWWFEAQAFQRWPLPQPRRLVLLRVFGAPSYQDLLNLVQPWFRVGDVAHLDGADSVSQREAVLEALEAGQVDDVLVKSEAEALARTRAWSREPDGQLLYRRHVEQCTAQSWQAMVTHLLDGGQAVLMDLSGLGPANQGCAWELGQLLNRVPLEQVTLLVDHSTDLDVLHGILAQAEAEIDATSPNAGRRQPWQALQIGGQSQRRADESHAAWLRRMDARLDGEALAGWLYRRAGPDAARTDPASVPTRFPTTSLSVCAALAVLAWLVLPR